MTVESLHEKIVSAPFTRGAMKTLIEETANVAELSGVLRTCILRSIGDEDGLSLSKALVLGVSNEFAWEVPLSKQVYRSAQENLPVQYLFEPYGRSAVPILLELVEDENRLSPYRLALAFQLLARHCSAHNPGKQTWDRLLDDIRKCNGHFTVGYSEASVLFVNCIHFLFSSDHIAANDRLIRQYPVGQEAAITLMINGVLEREILEHLPDSAQTAFWDEPLVRKAEKVGRNAPCPCGSGKKYKQCCLRKAVGVEQTYISARKKNFLDKEDDVRSFSAAEIADLSLEELRKLPILEMDRHQLVVAMRRAERKRDYRFALSFLSEMRKFYAESNGVLPGREIRTTIDGKKITIPKYENCYDDHVSDFVYALQAGKQLGLVERTLDLFFDCTSDDYRMASFLVSVHKNEPEKVLRYVEDTAFKGIMDPAKLVELFYSLENPYPGLSFAVFRSVVAAFPERIDDVSTMIDVVSDMVVKHSIQYEEEPSFHTFDDLYELRNQGEEDNPNLEEMKRLQRELRQAQNESAKLRRQSRKFQKKHAAEISSAPPQEKVSTVTEPDHAPADEAEILAYEERIRSSKSKIERLQDIIRSKQDSIQKLKKQVGNTPTERLDVDSTHSEYEDEIDAGALAATGVRIPEYSKEFRKALSSMEPSVCRSALRAITGFATNDERFLKQTKLLKSLDGYYSMRIGIHHRLIVEYRPGTNPIAKYLIHRKDLESIVKRLKK
jgi:hypothetical protein